VGVDVIDLLGSHTGVVQRMEDGERGAPAFRLRRDRVKTYVAPSLAEVIAEDRRNTRQRKYQ
jgi:hypothetical protein